METAKKSTQKELPKTITKLVDDPEYYITGTDFYTKFDTHFVTDTRLTHNALIILLYISSQSDTWKWNDSDIIRKMNFSKTPFYKAKKLLIDTGYVQMKKSYGHRFSKAEYYVDLTAYRFTMSTFTEVVKQPKFTMSTFTESLNTESLNTESLNTESLNEDTNIYNLNIDNLNIDNLNIDKNGDTSTKSLDSSSSPEGSIRNSENFAPQATQNVPQFDDVIFEKIKAESKVLMKDLPQPKLKLNSEIKNENNKLNESDTAMKIKLNNEYFDDNEMFVDDTTAISKIEDEINKLDSINASTANEYSAQENIKLDGDTDSVHSEIDVITPNIEMTEQQKLNDNLYDKAFNLFGDGLYAKIDNLDAMIDDEFGEDARKKLISNSDIVDDTDWKPIGKIDTTELKANAVKLMNKAFDTITAVDPTLDI